MPLATLAALAPVQSLPSPWPGVALKVKREDLLCSHLGGNKLYKLYFHLQRAMAEGAKTLVSFGGAGSNHLYALARVGQVLGFETRALVRGLDAKGQPPSALSPTLRDCAAMGMQLQFVSRDDYRLKTEVHFVRRHGLDAKGLYCIPEGGGDLLGAAGMAAYWQAVCQQLSPPSAVVLPVGTGASLAGILAASSAATQVLGVSSLGAGPDQLQPLKRRIQVMATRLHRRLSPGQTLAAWELAPGVFGRYGPAKGSALSAIHTLSHQLAIPLDPVYTGKAFLYAVEHLAPFFARLGQDALARQAQAQVLWIHTGGLQGGRRWPSDSLASDAPV